MRRFRPFRFLARLAGIALLVSILGLGYVYVANKGFRQAVQGLWIGANPRSAFGGRDAVTLMVLGRDEDRNNRDQVMATHARSDVILLARLDFKAKTIHILSIPRDTRVRIPGTRGYSKINAAHAIGGPDLAAETLHAFLGVKTDSALVVDYEMLQHVIDQMGGVRVKVDKPLDYDDDWGNLHIHLKPGWQTLGGRDAMGFVRYRHANEGPADSDLVRIERQQALLQAAKARLREPSTWMRVPGVLETVRKEMRGTLTYPQLVALAVFARSVPKENVSMHVLPNRPGRVFVYADPEETRALVAKLFPVDSVPRWTGGRGGDEPRTRRNRRRGTAVTVAEDKPAVPEAPEETTPSDIPAQDEPAAAIDLAPGDTSNETPPVQEPAPREEPKPAPAPEPAPAPSPAPPPPTAPQPSQG